MIYTIDPPFVVSPGDIVPFLLMSDLHYDDAQCRRDLIEADLEWANKHNAVVLLGGDWANAIFNRDRRSVPSVLAKEFVGSDTAVNDVIDAVAEFLAPYAGLVRFIGVGNHESALTRWGNVDMTSLLIERLNRHSKHGIIHGGYSGVIRFRFKRRNAKRDATVLNCYYHHGSGGAGSKVSKGVIEFSRIRVANADIIWLQHLHLKTVTPDAMWYIPQRGTKMIRRGCMKIRTSSYTEFDQKQHNKRGNYQYNWENETGLARQPESIGGARVYLKFNNDNTVTCSAEVDSA